MKTNAFECLLDQLDILDPLFERREIPADKEEALADIEKRAKELRDELFERKKRPLSEGQVSQLSQFTGRNVELAYQMFILSNLLGVDMDQDIVDAFAQKAIEEGEPLEIGFFLWRNFFVVGKLICCMG